MEFLTCLWNSEIVTFGIPRYRDLGVTLVCPYFGHSVRPITWKLSFEFPWGFKNGLVIFQIAEHTSAGHLACSSVQGTPWLSPASSAEASVKQFSVHTEQVRCNLRVCVRHLWRDALKFFSSLCSLTLYHCRVWAGRLWVSSFMTVTQGLGEFWNLDGAVFNLGSFYLAL